MQLFPVGSGTVAELPGSVLLPIIVPGAHCRLDHSVEIPGTNGGASLGLNDRPSLPERQSHEEETDD